VRYGLSNFFGAIAAWLCLAPVALTYEPLSTPSTLASTAAPSHDIANLPLFLIWITGGIFLVVGGILAFAPFRLRARKSDSWSRLAHAYRNSDLDLTWTVIPVMVLLLFLA